MNKPTAQELDLLHANVCLALSEPVRIHILYALHERPLHVSALAETLDLPQPTISRHLRVLRQRSLVLTEREGTTITYRLAAPRLIEALEIMRHILRDTLERQTSVLA